jgi:hypothetical protein
MGISHEQAITLAAEWYRKRYHVTGPVQVRSVREDEQSGYYCELYSEDVSDQIGVLVADDGRVEMIGEGIEYIKIRTVP